MIEPNEALRMVGIASIIFIGVTSLLIFIGIMMVLEAKNFTLRIKHKWQNFRRKKMKKNDMTLEGIHIAITLAIFVGLLKQHTNSILAAGFIGTFWCLNNILLELKK